LKPYNKLLRLVVLYIVGVLVVALVLGWSLLVAWATFLGLTAIVFILAFRNIFPPRSRNSGHKLAWGGRNETPARKELESMIMRGFEEDDLKARAKTFETLKRIIGRKIKRRYGMSEAEFKALTENPTRLDAILGDPELVQVLSAKLNLRSKVWDLGRLSQLIGKVEDWGR
jgi:hypothetical protein